MKKQIVRRVFAVFFAFLLSLTLTMALLVTVLQTTLLNRSYMERCLDKTNTYRVLAAEIATLLAHESMIIGFDEAFFENFLTDEYMRPPVLASADTIYTGQPAPAIDRTQMTARFQTAFVEEMQRRGDTPDEEQIASLQPLAQICADVFATHARLRLPADIGTLKLHSIVSQIRSLTPTVLWFSWIMSACFAGIVLSLDDRRPRALSYAFGGTMLMCGVPSLWLVLSGSVGKLFVSQDAMAILYRALFNGMFEGLLIIAGILLISGVLLAVWSLYRENRPITDDHTSSVVKHRYI